FGAVSVAAACLIEGSVAMRLASVKDGDVKQVSVEHSMGEFTVELRLHNGQLVSCGLMRTARLLLDGAVCVPTNLWNDRDASQR
ncbi:4-oxalomesaconate tautomerase, partial [Pseudomonas sp. HMWF031]